MAHIVDPLVLIVAAPDGHACAIAEALHGELGLPGHFGNEGLVVVRVGRATEHEVLPYENAHVVAGLVEGLVLIDAAPPYTKHVHVGVAS